mmetsp:Transcript_5235/g.12883  ORF Transcript_5235/g.12883 Transcript_5235/m.12883 type:complete len:430 (-) Transcript_5235:23-1312(-)
MSAVRHRKHQADTSFDSTSTHDSNHEPLNTSNMSVASRNRSPSRSPGPKSITKELGDDDAMKNMMKPLMVEERDSPVNIPMGADSSSNGRVVTAFSGNAGTSDIYQQGLKLAFCFAGLQASYLTWGYMQELIMTTVFEPTEGSPNGKFPSAAFCVFSNRFLAVIVGAIACRIKHGAFFANNVAPVYSFLPCALSNTLSSWSQYASLKYVAFPVQTVFKSSKIIPVMMMGKFLKGNEYPFGQYIEAFLITVGVAIFSLTTKTSNSDASTETKGLIFMVMYICCDSFTSQWQDKIYQQYGRSNVDQYQMMLCVNSCAIVITTAGLFVSGDIPVVYEFLSTNPVALYYNIITAITSATGQLFIFYTIKEFGPIVFTVIMTTRQLFSITISCIIFGHAISGKSMMGAVLVFSVIFYQIRRKYLARMARQNGGS